MKWLLVGFVLATSTPAGAVRPITFADVCPGYTLSKRGDDVLIRCPGDPIDKPWMTYKDCKRVTVERGASSVKITCA